MTPVLPELVSYLEGQPEPHILFDRQYRIVAANAAYRRAFSPGASVIGRRCHEVSHHTEVPCNEAGESCPLARSLESGQRERVLHLHHTPQGEAYVQIELVPLRDASGEAVWFIERMEPLRVAQGQPAARGLIGRAPAFQEMLALVARVGPSMASVLLLGESGTGKELLARAVHEASPRVSAPLVVVDCASMPESLFESELFGHERGAFTGATSARAGLVEAASGGTLFLDEVGDIPMPMQVKLLRLLESGTYRRVGSTDLRHADVRVVSATHRQLRAMVAEGRFREDLYFRLSTFPIRVPALRERPEDIGLLAEALLARIAPGRTLTLAPAALQVLCGHDFPGNVRELRNILERASLMADGTTLHAEHIEKALAVDRPAATDRGAAPPTPAPGRGAVWEASSAWPPALPPGGIDRRQRDRDELRARLAAHRGSRADLAREMGISLRSLYRRLRELEADAS